MTEELHRPEVYLQRLAQDMKTIRQQMTEVINSIRQAESEVPESMRRFITYMHDLHDVCYMYESRGLPVPRHIFEEMERCDDRYRQLLEAQHAEGGTFNRVRREMAADPKNRWDHTRLLNKPQEQK